MLYLVNEITSECNMGIRLKQMAPISHGARKPSATLVSVGLSFGLCRFLTSDPNSENELTMSLP